MNCLFTIALLALTTLNTHALFLPIKTNYPRCLHEFTIGNNEGNSLKIRINFPDIKDAEPGEHFTFTMKNTEDQKTKSQIVRPGGKIVRDEVLESNVIYELCLHLKSDRTLDLLIEYDSEARFNYQHSEIKVPETLLTKKDMSAAYVSASILTNTIQSYQQDHKDRRTEQKSAFIQTAELNQSLNMISGIQIVIVIAAGVYQFFTLKEYLSSKQYL